jgi:rhamnogalacturonyl hydrolase YesR
MKLEVMNIRLVILALCLGTSLNIYPADPLKFAAIPDVHFGNEPFAGAAGEEFRPDYIKETLNKVAKWQLNHPLHSTRDWTNGVFYAGVFAAWQTTQSDALYQALLDMGNANRWQPGELWFHSDDHVICQTYIDLYRIEKRDEMIRAFEDTLALFIAKPHPVQYGHDKIKWWWCDALFMGPPAMVKLGIATGNREYLKESDTYFHECYDLLFNKEEHLFARDLEYVIKNDSRDRYEANGKKIFWSRGNGWVMGGLARILGELPAGYPERPFYEGLFKEMAARIVSLQPDDGLWRASLLDPGSYPGGEVSGSGFYCYALAWGINSGLLDRKTYLPAVKKTWVALNKCVSEEGRVGWVQPIGASPQQDFNASSWEVYGTGAFLLAGSEIIKLKQ